MKKSIILSFILILVISCTSVDSSKYINTKWQLIKLKIEDNGDQEYLEQVRANLENGADHLTQEQIDKEMEIALKSITDPAYCNVSGKDNIAFTEDGQYLDYNGTIKGGYHLSLDGKRMMINRSSGRIDTLYVIKLSKNELELRSGHVIKIYKPMD